LGYGSHAISIGEKNCVNSAIKKYPIGRIEGDHCTRSMVHDNEYEFNVEERLYTKPWLSLIAKEQVFNHYKSSYPSTYRQPSFTDGIFWQKTWNLFPSLKSSKEIRKVLTPGQLTKANKYLPISEHHPHAVSTHRKIFVNLGELEAMRQEFRITGGLNVSSEDGTMDGFIAYEQDHLLGIPDLPQSIHDLPQLYTRSNAQENVPQRMEPDIDPPPKQKVISKKRKVTEHLEPDENIELGGDVEPENNHPDEYIIAVEPFKDDISKDDGSVEISKMFAMKKYERPLKKRGIILPKRTPRNRNKLVI